MTLSHKLGGSDDLTKPPPRVFLTCSLVNKCNGSAFCLNRILFLVHVKITNSKKSHDSQDSFAGKTVSYSYIPSYLVAPRMETDGISGDWDPENTILDASISSAYAFFRLIALDRLPPHWSYTGGCTPGAVYGSQETRFNLSNTQRNQVDDTNTWPLYWLYTNNAIYR